MSRARVTVGIPFKNAERTLAAAIRSVLAQSFPDFDLLLVDDGSTDDSLRVASDFGDPRIRVLHDGASYGLAARLNQIAAAAETEYLVRMDSDDAMQRDRLATQTAALDADRALDVVGSRCLAVVGERVAGLYVEGDVPSTAAGHLANNALSHPTVAGRTEWFRTHPYDVSLCRTEDKELWLRTHSVSKVAKLPQALLFYRLRVVPSSVFHRTSVEDRRLMRDHAPAIVGKAATWALVGRSLAKEAAGHALRLSPSGTRLLTERRIAPMAEADRAAAQAEFDSYASRDDERRGD